MKWGEALPVRWSTQADGAVSVHPPGHFLTDHGKSAVLWRIAQGPTRPVAAFHVSFPAGLQGEVRHQVSDMGLVLHKRPWRRRRENSWWPGELQIFRDRVEWRDHEALLPLWSPDKSEAERLLRGELGPAGTLNVDQFHWPELYLALCQDHRFLEAVRDNDFAASTYSFFVSRNLVRSHDASRMMTSSERRYGDMLAAWRRCGEGYLDFWLDLDGTPDATHVPILTEMLNAAGYRTDG